MRGIRRIPSFAAFLLAASSLSCNADHKAAEPDPEWAYAFVDTCLATNLLDTSAWKQVDAHKISFRIPSNYVSTNRQSIDVDSGEFAAVGRNIGYCARCSPYTYGNQSYFRCREIIDGRKTFIVSGRLDDGRYFTGATWQNPGGGFFVMGGYSPDSEGHKEALAIIRSVRFKEAFYEHDE